MIRFLLLAGATVIAAPLAAQTSPADGPGTPLPYDLGHDNNSPRSNAGALQSRPATSAANRQALAETAQGGAVVAGDQARYATDVDAYRAALRAHGRDLAVNAQQERAYAMAMADWRAQVDACDRGRRRACEAPAPNPADYW